MESLPSVGHALPPRGFTLVEMIVVLAIIGIITAVVLVGQGNFDNSLTLTDTAYTVALSVREAQTFGLSSRTYNTVKDAPYGVQFSINSPKNYTLFADIYPVSPGTESSYCAVHTAPAGSPDAKPGDCLYEPNNSELIQTFTFGRGFAVSNVCGKDAGGIQHCAVGGAGSSITGVNVLYLRPNTDSVVVGLTASTPTPLVDAQITLAAPQGGTRNICVTSVGEVSVSATTCP